MTEQIFVGVDGGATKCIVTVEDANGHLLGREISGPANIRLSVDSAWSAINSALQKILAKHHLSLSDKNYAFHAGMGLAGCEVQEAYQAFIQRHHEFTTLKITSDAHTACLGAHRGADGAIIIAGTGVVGFQLHQQQITKISGWGFPQDDEGGGAWLGLEAVKITLQALDGRIPVSNLSTAVYDFFKQNHADFIAWTNQANSTAFATLAPIVIQQSLLQDEAAIILMQRAASAINLVDSALVKAAGMALPTVLVGGIADYLAPYLSANLRARLQAAAATPDMGALMLIKEFVLNRKDTV